ncbi:MAG: hypothetical protein ACJZ9G_01395 [Rhodospirillales bacterium]
MSEERILHLLLFRCLGVPKVVGLEHQNPENQNGGFLVFSEAYLIRTFGTP